MTSLHIKLICTGTGWWDGNCRGPQKTLNSLKSLMILFLFLFTFESMGSLHELTWSVGRLVGWLVYNIIVTDFIIKMKIPYFMSLFALFGFSFRFSLKLATANINTYSNHIYHHALYYICTESSCFGRGGWGVDHWE